MNEIAKLIRSKKGQPPDIYYRVACYKVLASYKIEAVIIAILTNHNKHCCRYWKNLHNTYVTKENKEYDKIYKELKKDVTGLVYALQNDVLNDEV
jgi:hypothetical protein